jgi:hypothetical protein
MRKTIKVFGSPTNVSVIIAMLIVLRSELDLHYFVRTEDVTEVQADIMLNADEAFNIINAVKVTYDLYLERYSLGDCSGFNKLVGEIISYLTITDLKSPGLTEGEIVSGMMEYLK